MFRKKLCKCHISFPYDPEGSSKVEGRSVLWLFCFIHLQWSMKICLCVSSYCTYNYMTYVLLFPCGRLQLQLPGFMSWEQASPKPLQEIICLLISFVTYDKEKWYILIDFLEELACTIQGVRHTTLLSSLVCSSHFVLEQHNINTIKNIAWRLNWKFAQLI